MKQSRNGSEISKLVKFLEHVIDQIKSVEKLSLFERGQREGLLWALDLAKEVEKTSGANLKTSTRG